MLYVFTFLQCGGEEYYTFGGEILYLWGKNDINLYFKSPFLSLRLIFISDSFVSVLVNSKNKAKQV